MTQDFTDVASTLEALKAMPTEPMSQVTKDLLVNCAEEIKHLMQRKAALCENLRQTGHFATAIMPMLVMEHVGQTYRIAKDAGMDAERIFNQEVLGLIKAAADAKALVKEGAFK
jgi:hypothetical protein